MDNNNILQRDLTFLKGVGEKRANIIKRELNIASWGDLLYHFPYRYVDKSQYFKINQIVSEDLYVQIRGVIMGKSYKQSGKTQRLVYTFQDGTGIAELVFFKGLSWIEKKLLPNKEYVIFGKPTKFKNTFSFVHPEIEEALIYANQSIEEKFSPMYNTSERMKKAFINSKTVSKYIKEILIETEGRLEETLPDYVLKLNNLYPLQTALREIHFPSSANSLAKAKYRLKFEELFLLQLGHLFEKGRRISKSKGFVFSNVGEKFNSFYSENLPFPLTNAQKRVIKEIRKDMRSGHQMNRLLQGDVGSGKTLVALMCMLIAIDNGFQTALLAPTEILATQHYHSLTKFLAGLNVNVALLQGSIKGKARKNILSNLEEGAIDIIVGTHAVLEDTVVFSNLGLAVIDEQHRFWVKQRSKMWQKNNVLPPHILVMTATPIPRTLAMTAYGDLDYSVIDELPPGRKPIRTVHLYDRDILKMFAFMHRQIKEGRQIYIVYPLINENETMDVKDLMDGYESIVREFPLPEYQISIVHGQMKEADKDYEMQRFAKGQTNIMVATTVIEVGVDVSNATVMIIENSERFGLSQLHQLRGRVGRGGNQSYCILRTKDNLSKEAAHKIDVMCQSNDGFVLAEEDLKMRGPGNISGTEQSGILDLKIADIIKDEPIVRRARDFAALVFDKDNSLTHPDNILLRNAVLKQRPLTDFSKIS
ncbi:MAG: ATP-dependent DNA helicase RecG [Bacteroidales bacterium]|nr:ATP-dependent DNA helicase RecG [Bacteroidales bacterium]